ncbi:MAG TPA: anti-sigma regulatory factor [Blastocatellia bacterium]|nr:anti-sigma regulatory factor [Blastocatellia bacterium]
MQPPDERIQIAASEDLVTLRRAVRERATALGFGHTDQVRLVTAASELGRNIVLYAGRGFADLATVSAKGRRGLRICFVDEGQGIDDIELALKDGYTSGRGLGKGLPGARRLVDEFEITSAVGRGTVVTITKWL